MPPKLKLKPVAIAWLAAGLNIASGSELSVPKLSDVFISGQDGYHTYRIAALVVSTNGTLLAFCEGRRHGAGDTGKIDLLLKRSEDGGANWRQQPVVRADGENVCGNPAPVVDRQTGMIWLLTTWNLGNDHEQQIVLGTGKDTRRVFVTHSADDGLTWSQSVEITAGVKKPGWRWYATGPVNGIQLVLGRYKGRLVIPANHSEPGEAGTQVSRSHVIFSDDHGLTWRLGGVEDKKTNESTLAERADGSLLQNMRSYLGQNLRAVGISTDGGLSWSHARLDPALVEPVCQASLLRATWPGPNGRSRLLFANPASTRRENLTLRISYDEGASWPVAQVLHQGPSAYSCLAMLTDHDIACLFECGEKNPYQRIVLAPLRLGEQAGIEPEPPNGASLPKR